VRCLARIDPQVAGSASHHQANVAVALGVGGYRGDDRLAHLFPIHGNFQADGAGAIVKTIDMAFQAEDFSFLNANPFEDAVAVKQPVVVHADLGVRFVVQLAADEDFGSHVIPHSEVEVGSSTRPSTIRTTRSVSATISWL